MHCWSEREKTAVDRVFPQLRSTRQDRHRAERIQKRIRAAERHCSKHGGSVPQDHGDDNSTDEEQPDHEQPPKRKYRAPVPGDFVLTFNVLLLVTGKESKFPHRREYWMVWHRRHSLRVIQFLGAQLALATPWL